MKRMLFGALAVAGATAALAAPASAQASTAGPACDKPVVKCVNEVLIWIVTYDPCLLCDEAAGRP